MSSTTCLSPAYHTGDRLRHREVGWTFIVDEVVMLKPEGRIGYGLRCETSPGFRLNQFESEVLADFEQV